MKCTVSIHCIELTVLKPISAVLIVHTRSRNYNEIFYLIILINFYLNVGANDLEILLL